MSQLSQIVHTVVLEDLKPARQVAEEIGKPYSTLLREVNPYDQSAKLGIDTLLEIMQCTGNVTPLEYMAEQLGYHLSDETDDVLTDNNLPDNIYGGHTEAAL